MAHLICQVCKRPVDKHAAKLGAGRVCKRCIKAAREQQSSVFTRNDAALDFNGADGGDF